MTRSLPAAFTRGLKPSQLKQARRNMDMLRSGEIDRILEDTLAILKRDGYVRASTSGRPRMAAASTRLAPPAPAVRQPTIHERAAENGMTVDELAAVGEVAQHLNAYCDQRKVFARQSISLSEYIFCELVEAGDLSLEFGGDDVLAKYKPHLASALKKLDERFPLPGNPLAPVADDMEFN